MYTKVCNHLPGESKRCLPKISEYQERLRKTDLSHFVLLGIKSLFDQKVLLLTDYSRVKITYVLRGLVFNYSVGVTEHCLCKFKYDIENSCWLAVFYLTFL